MDKNSRVIWIIVLLVAAGVIYKMLHHKSIPAPAPVVAVSPSPAPTLSPPPSPTPNAETPPPSPAPSLAQEPDVGSSDEKNTPEFKVFKSPVCMSVRNGIINLPSIYLRQFYSESKSWIALPQSYAKCLKSGTVVNAMFYEFDAVHQFPFRPLVKMSGFISSIKEFPTLSSLKAVHAKADYKVKVGRKDRTDIFASIESLFSIKLMEPWVEVVIVRNNIEDKPSFWPNLPPVHPIAKIISKAELPKGNEWSKNYTIMDVRHAFQKEQFTLPFQTQMKFSLRFASDQRAILNSNKFRVDENKFIFKKGKQTPFLIIGRSMGDLTAYNAANFLALAGYKSITIVKEGAEGWGAPSPPNISVGAPSLTPANLNKLQKEAKKKNTELVILDCRNTRESSRSSIAGSINIPFKDDDSADEEDNAESTPASPTKQSNGEEGDEKERRGLDMDIVEKKLKSMKIDTLVVYGRSANDDKSKRRARFFIEKVHPPKAYILEDGYEGWQFFAAYKWTPEDPKAKKLREEMLGKSKDLRKFYGPSNSSQKKQASTTAKEGKTPKSAEEKLENREKTKNMTDAEFQDQENKREERHEERQQRKQDLQQKKQERKGKH